MGFQGLAIEVGRPITMLRPILGFSGIIIEKGVTRTFLRPVSGFAGLSTERTQSTGLVRTTIIRKAQ